MSPSPEEPTHQAPPEQKAHSLNLLLGIAACAFLCSVVMAVWPSARSAVPWLVPALAAYVLFKVWRLRRNLSRLAAAPPTTGPPGALPTTPSNRHDSASTSSPPRVDEEAEHFVYSISHDLRAPLRIVLGFARILKEDHANALDRPGVDHLERIEHAAQRMEAMIEALLSLSRLSSRPLEHRSVNLSELAHSVLDELQLSAPERRVDLRITENMHCEGDPTLLRLVLENLLGNAWKYSAKREKAVIEFGVAQDPGHARVFHVRDNGAGFDMRYADKLFAPFQRLHTATEFEGTGIGLASARRIIHRHGGRLWGKGSVDQGACFCFTLEKSPDLRT